MNACQSSEPGESPFEFFIKVDYINFIRGDSLEPSYSVRVWRLSRIAFRFSCPSIFFIYEMVDCFYFILFTFCQDVWPSSNSVGLHETNIGSYRQDIYPKAPGFIAVMRLWSGTGPLPRILCASKSEASSHPFFFFFFFFFLHDWADPGLFWIAVVVFVDTGMKKRINPTDIDNIVMN